MSSRNEDQPNLNELPQPPPPPPTFPYFVSNSVFNLHHEIFQKTVDLILKKGVFFNSEKERQKAPFKFKNPDQLKRMMNFDLGKEPLLEKKAISTDSNLNRGLRKGQEELLKYLEFIIDYSPHASHPFMVSKNLAGLDPYGIIGDWLSVTLNTVVVTYFMSPMFTLMENEVEERYRNLVGYPKGEGDGMVTLGQGIGNSYAIQMALQTKFPKLKNKGFFGIGSPQAVMFVSEQGDYSFEKNCISEGIGINACIRIKSNLQGRMDLENLSSKIEECIAEGKVPFLLVATAGTSILGAIDSIEEMANIAKAHNMWLHVDGHLAGSLVFSNKYHKRLAGIEKSDSVLWSPSKMLAAPYCMSVLVTKKTNKLEETFRPGGRLVYQYDTMYDHKKWDNANKTMQTTRRPDILKIWFMWKAKGRKGFENQIDATCANAKFCMEELKARRGRFKPIIEEVDCNLVCFYFIPQVIRLRSDADIVKIINKNMFTQTLKNKLLLDGIMEISIGELPRRNDLPSFFVMNLNNTAITAADIKYMLDQIEYWGDRIIILNPLRDITVLEELIQIPPIESTKILSLLPPIVPKPPKTYPDYVSAPIESMHLPLFQRLFEVVFKIGTYFQNKRQDSSYLFEQPETLLQKFDFSLKDSTDDSGHKSVNALLKIVKSIIKYCAHLGHPYFNYHLGIGLDPYTMIADYMNSCMTSPMYTYEDGPVYTLMEDAVANAVIKRCGFKEGSGTGLLLPGGSLGNQLAISLAYLKKFPNSKISGNKISQAESVIFISAGAHYSLDKGAFFQGIGKSNCVSVRMDEAGKMDVQDLIEKVYHAQSKGKIPIMVCATIGTTVLGAFDPLTEIADICQQHGMWLHLDGAYGGAVIMSDSQRYRLKGIQRADSFTFNAHKMLAASRCTTVWVTKHSSILREVSPFPSKQKFRLNPQLYDGAKYDHGEFHPCTDRRPGILKLWFLWKAKGIVGLGSQVDRGYSLTSYANSRLQDLYKHTKRFQPSLQGSPEATHINFIYVPQHLQSLDQVSSEFQEKIATVQNSIFQDVIFNKNFVCALEPIGDRRPNSLIFCLYNSALTEQDVDYFFQVVDYYGQNINWDRVCEHCIAEPVV